METVEPHPDGPPDFNRLVQEIIGTYQDDSGTNFIDVKNLPVKERVVFIIDCCWLLFPVVGKRVTRQNIESVCWNCWWCCVGLAGS